MLDNCKSAQERWGGVSDIIDRWLKERQELIVLFWKLSEAAEDTNEETCGASLKNLCEILVDYVSAGYFEVYDQLVKEAEEFGNEKGLALAGKSFKIIDESTEYILDFNDKYLETDDLETIHADLSKLGELLAHRFEAEDSVIEVLHYSNKDKLNEQDEVTQ